MAMNEEALKAALAGKVQPTSTPADPTNNFSEDKPKGARAPLTDAEKAAREAMREKKANVVSITRKQAQAKITKEERELRMAISDKAYVAGYITAKGPHVDFAASTVKNDGSNTYNVTLKQFGPSAIKFVVVMVPELLMGLLEKRNFSGTEFQEKFVEYKAQTIEATVFRPELVAWPEFNSWMLNHTAGYLNEAEALFAPYVSKTKRVDTPADVKAKSNGIPGGSCVYLKTRFGAQDVSKATVVAHNFRAKILTPDNYIALQRYVDVPISSNYSESEASEMIFKYLSKFQNVPKGAEHPKSARFSPEASRSITVDPASHKILATSFFPQGGAAWYFADKSNGIAHWSNKVVSVDAEQKAVVEPAMLPAPVISEKVIYEKKSNGETMKASKYVTEKLVEAGSTVSTYKFDDATFPKIFKATKGLLSLRMIEDVVAANKSVKVSSGKKKLTTTLAPSDIIGLTNEEIFNLIKNNG